MVSPLPCGGGRLGRPRAHVPEHESLGPQDPGSLESDFYDLASFRKGRIALHPLEQEELGDVRGRSLLHLQCHFGMDTLSWARLGALVTGADYSEEAIAVARSLAEDLD